MSEKKEKPTNKKFMIIAGLGLILVFLGSFGGFYLHMKNNNKEEKKIVQNYYDLQEFMVNLKDGRKYLKTAITVGYDSKNKKALGLLEGNHIVLRDATIFYLKSKEANDFKAGNEGKIKKGLVEALNKELGLNLVLDIYINDIIVQ